MGIWDFPQEDCKDHEMINLDDIKTKREKHPLYVHPTVLIHFRKNNLMDFIEIEGVSYGTIQDRLVVQDKEAQEYSDILTAGEILGYSAVKQYLAPLEKVTKYNEAMKRRQDAWEAKSVFYRVRYNLNEWRWSAIQELVRKLERFLFAATAWLGKGLDVHKP